MSLGHLPVTEPEEDVEFFELTPAEWEYGRQMTLAAAGVTYEELQAQARSGHFASHELRNIWVLLGDHGDGR